MLRHAPPELHDTFTFISDVLQIFKITRQLRDEVINNEQGTSVEVIEEKKGDAVLVFQETTLS